MYGRSYIIIKEILGISDPKVGAVFYNTVYPFTGGLMQTALWLPNIVTVLLNFILFLLVYRLRDKTGAFSGLFMIGGIIGWSLTESLLWIGLEIKWVLILCRIQYVFIITVIFSFLFFVIYFSGRGDRLSFRRLWFLFIPPVFILLMIWTNDVHKLFYRSFELIQSNEGLKFQKEYGPFFLLWSVYAYALIVWAFGMIIKSYGEANCHYRKQYLAVLAGASIPALANISYLFNLYPNSQLDITPMAYTGTALFLAWAVFRKRMFDLQPIARRQVFSLMSDGILVLDTKERIVDINPSAEKLFGINEDRAVGSQAEGLFSDDPELNDSLKRSGSHIVSTTNAGKACHYSLSNTPIRDKRGFSLGRLIVLRDITEQKILEKKLEVQAATDPLTGVMNRRYFTELSEKEFARSHRKGNPLALIILDIDHFKSVNDNYGHHIGDLVLKALCDECSHCLRESDLLGRWGGEEFIILLPETDLDTAFMVAERLRLKIMEMKTPVSDKTESGEFLSVTVSLGITVVEPSENTLQEAFKRADRALYRSKQEGRNRVSSC